jgi:alcohol dehydrogenase
MSALGVLRAPDQALFGHGMAAAVGNLASQLGRRALICTDSHVAGTAGFEKICAALDARDLQTRIFNGGAPDVPLATAGAAWHGDIKRLDPLEASI